MTIILPSDL